MTTGIPRPNDFRRTTPTSITPHPDDDCIRHALKLAFAAVRKELDASLRTLGLTAPQWRVLDFIQRRPGVTHTELVACLGIEASSVTSLVEGLERRGPVEPRHACCNERNGDAYHADRHGRQVRSGVAGLGGIGG